MKEEAFSAEWLKLREEADRRARNDDVAATLSARFQLRDRVRVIDLGCGAGANLRATSSLLPASQEWTLIDANPALLKACRSELATWADDVVIDGPDLRIRKGAASIHVRFGQIDLARDLAGALKAPFDLVTASAFFDLASADFIKDVARRTVAERAAFYAVLTYNGLQRWTPHRPADNQMTSAFHRHQMTDKGLGPAAGPTAIAHLGDQFRLAGYAVVEGDSPWRLGRADRMLIDELVRGHAMAVAETRLVDAKTIESWVNVQRSGAETGHADIFAAPA